MAADKLVIVESPGKVGSIEKYLGPGYTVMASIGHVRDLPKKKLNIDVENGFAPHYEVLPEKKQVIAGLKKQIKQSSSVILATDPDREGEAISFHLCEALGLPLATTQRIVFTEITKDGVLRALEKPRTIDMNLVNAQQARRVLDRLVGYELSPVLWKKIATGLSAGRVQSVATRLIVEREREIEAFSPIGSFRIIGAFPIGKAELKAECPERPELEGARSYLAATGSGSWTVADVTSKPGTRNPAAPFTTSTLQQAAAQKLGYTVKQTMQVAQRLYEAGLITYMRTDSTALAGSAQAAIASFIEGTYGRDYLQVRTFKTKNASAQEAHEAIRPTDISRESAANPQWNKLYQLIRQRTLASQMAAARIQKTKVTLQHAGHAWPLVADGEVVEFDGFLKVYGLEDGDELGNSLPPVSVGQQLQASSLTARETFSRPPARYSEASLVKELEERGIGRPSTYAPTISTIIDRGYVEKGDRDGDERAVRLLVATGNGQVDETLETERTGSDKGRLLPTAMGRVVTDFLVEHFGQIADYAFTAQMEQQLDDIADGAAEWQKVMDAFYKEFHPQVAAKSEGLSRSESGSMRLLGQHPVSGKPVFVAIGRFGPYVQVGDKTAGDEPTYTKLPAKAAIDSITLEEAMREVGKQRTLGEQDGNPIEVKVGRFGPYLKWGEKTANLRGIDPANITLGAAIELLNQDKSTIGLLRDLGGGITVRTGRFGPYVTDGTVNASLRKGMTADNMTTETATMLLEAKKARGPSTGRWGRRGAAAKAPAAEKKTTTKKTAAKKATAAKKTTSAKAKATTVKKPAAAKKTTAVKKAATTKAAAKPAAAKKPATAKKKAV